ncbi:MAG: hypothetical protein IH831_05900 [Planctomycetes bacterium]|nr:hypothetical protein [Planctomycetota bacterium]
MTSRFTARPVLVTTTVADTAVACLSAVADRVGRFEAVDRWFNGDPEVG